VLHDPQKNSNHHPVQNLQSVKSMWPVIIINATCQTNATIATNNALRNTECVILCKACISDVVLNLHDA
jgi:3-dehydroquinate dehydratase